MYGMNFAMSHARAQADYVYCECCERILNQDEDVVTVWGKITLCSECERTRIPDPGERVTVTDVDSPHFGYSYIVDAVMNGQVLLRVGTTFKLFELKDTVRSINGKPKRK
jgi:hypothetical protein